MQTFRKCLRSSNNFVSQLRVGVSFGLHNRVQRAQIRSRQHRSQSSQCRATIYSAVRCTRPDVELRSTLGLVQGIELSSRSSHCRATLDSAVCCTRPDLELRSTLGLVQGIALSGRSSQCRATLDSDVRCTGPISSSDLHWVWCKV
jgi:hypothetical protein